MVTIFTDDDRRLQYGYDELVTVITLSNRGGLFMDRRRANELEQGDWVKVKGTGKRADREIDLAYVKEIAH